jgi:dihydroxyacetone kinase-like predicted kinase
MVQASLSWLRVGQQAVRALNVFPVPGSVPARILLTMQAAWRRSKGGRRDDSSHRVRRRAARSWARGNSRHPLAIVAGFARGWIASRRWARPTRRRDARELQHSHQGVIRPVEGTILSVSRAAAEAAESRQDDGRPDAGSSKLLAPGGRRRTPAQLDVLRQAGVVDAGGEGLAVIFEGMLRHLKGEPVDMEPVAATLAFAPGVHLEGIEAGQDYELVFDLKPRPNLDWDTMHQGLSKFGTSIQIGGGDDALKIHILVPTESFYRTQEYAFTLGSVTKIAVENLQEQIARWGTGARTLHASRWRHRHDRRRAGRGLADVFQSLGESTGPRRADDEPEHGRVCRDQALPCGRAILIPNNGNAILAARQAAELSGRQVAVVPTRRSARHCGHARLQSAGRTGGQRTRDGCVRSTRAHRRSDDRHARRRNERRQGPAGAAHRPAGRRAGCGR